MKIDVYYQCLRADCDALAPPAPKLADVPPGCRLDEANAACGFETPSKDAEVSSEEFELSSFFCAFFFLGLRMALLNLSETVFNSGWYVGWESGSSVRLSTCTSLIRKTLMNAYQSP